MKKLESGDRSKSDNKVISGKISGIKQLASLINKLGGGGGGGAGGDIST